VGERLVWLTRRATASIEESELRISPIVQPPRALLSQLGLKLCSHPFPAIVQTALFETWTRDPFDRMIVAQAWSNGYAPLVTSDGSSPAGRARFGRHLFGRIRVTGFPRQRASVYILTSWAG
jgi:hypothetical protein